MNAHLLAFLANTFLRSIQLIEGQVFHQRDILSSQMWNQALTSDGIWLSSKLRLAVPMGKVWVKCNTYVSLSADISIQGWMANMSVYITLHHGAAIVVFDIAFPSRLRQGRAFGEALLSKILDRIIVCICQEIVEFHFTRMVFQFVHQARPIAFNLFLCGHC